MNFIVIEGLDGAGKSTQIKLLKKYYTDQGHKPEYLHFPRTDSPYFGYLIARFLRGEFGSINDVDPYLVAMLYAGDRKDAAALISRWLSNGKMVILDRYTYSNIAYQCAKLDSDVARENLKKWILDLEFRHFGIPEPDLNIFLDVPFIFTQNKLSKTRNGNDRSYLNGQSDIHESSLDFQSRVRDIYLEVAGSDKKLRIVNCNDKSGGMLPPGDIFGLILGLIKQTK